ncbi:MAG: TPM domain-containing protein, partial [Bacillota bacterium]|nr:TPM domain-containing protein [Bacillota bacterium]
MVKGKLKIVVCVVFVLLLFVQPVHAEKELVVDQADVFSGSEIVQLAEEARLLGESYGMDIVIVTTQDARGKTAREYADDFFDEQGYGIGDDYSGILFLIDYDNREAYVSTSGLAIRYLTDQRIESVLDAVIDGGLA